MHRTIVGIGLIVVLVGATVAADERVTRREGILRDGPGSFYDTVTNVAARLPVATGETKDRWVSSRVGARGGWLPSIVFEAPRAGVDYSGLLADGSAVPLSSADIAAATKGAFNAAYAARHKADFATVARLDWARGWPTLIAEIEQSLNDRDSAGLLGALPRRPFDTTLVLMPDAEMVLGRALAASLVGPGLVDDEWRVRYVNSVAAVVGRKTERYDMAYRVGILNESAPNGFGIPGGYVLVSKGLLDAARDEAELACLLGHEMSHISLYHGLREFKKRELHRRRDQVFAEMEAATGGVDEAEQELNELMDQCYLRVIGERASGDELEADLFGVAYASAAGYDPMAFVDFLQRLGQAGMPVDSFRHHPRIDQRVEALREAIAKYRLQRSGQVRPPLRAPSARSPASRAPAAAPGVGEPEAIAPTGLTR